MTDLDTVGPCADCGKESKLERHVCVDITRAPPGAVGVALEDSRMVCAACARACTTGRKATAKDPTAHVVASLRRLAEDLERGEARITKIDNSPTETTGYSWGPEWVTEECWAYTVEGRGAPGTLSVKVTEVRPVEPGAWRIR